MGFQNKLQKKTAPLQKKLFDIHLSHIGDEESLILINLEEDRFGNSEYTVKESKIVTGYLDFPDNEVPIVNLTGTNINSQSTTTFHLYDLLPIEGFFRFEDNLQLQDILVKPYEIIEGEVYKCVILQAVDTVQRFSSVSGVWQKWILAPPTFSTELYPEIIDIINQKSLEAQTDWIPEV